MNDYQKSLLAKELVHLSVVPGLDKLSPDTLIALASELIQEEMYRLRLQDGTFSLPVFKFVIALKRHGGNSVALTALAIKAVGDNYLVAPAFLEAWAQVLEAKEQQ